ncbi:MAG: shikimate dehydrogenase [Ferruginibacter sp.]|nr:shikimate dehydrogenase [Ferruginibacter sp.]
MKLYGLIGYPLGHSFSKQYFTGKFEKEGLTDCFFEAFPINSINELGALLSANPLLKGLSVTIPYKEQVLRFVDELSEEVKFIGASNCIKIRGNKLIAYNTDIIGFEQSFNKKLPKGQTKALVLGTGGASKAVQYVLNSAGIEFLVVTRQGVLKDGFIQYKHMHPQILGEYRIIINCTPAGMYPHQNTAPEIPYQLLTTSHYLFDLVYQPAKTLFLQKGEERGAAIQNGYDMLLIQAEESWKIWNSR